MRELDIVVTEQIIAKRLFWIWLILLVSIFTNFIDSNHGHRQQKQILDLQDRVNILEMKTVDVPRKVEE